MGFLSSSVSITRYRVEGRLDEPVIETIAAGLKHNAIIDIDNEASDIAFGWTSFENPLMPNFDGSSFVIGPHFFFSLRIDKKSLSPKIVNKLYLTELKKRELDSGREFLPKEEKKILKEEIVNSLYRKIPATPNSYDLVWKYEEAELLFFSHQKKINETLETLFSKSFKLNLIRLFPYTAAMLDSNLTENILDQIGYLSPTSFTE